MRLVAVSVALAALSIPTAAIAQPTSATPEEEAYVGAGVASTSAADSLFAEGRRAMQEGRTAEACQNFAESQELEPAGGTLLNLARCEAKLGHVATAWLAYGEAAALSVGNEKRAAVARDQQAVLLPQVPMVRVRITDPTRYSGLEVSVDGKLIGSEAWEKPIPIDPGDHVFVVRAPGFTEQTRNFVLKPADRLDLVLPALTPGTVAAATSADKTGEARTPSPEHSGAKVDATESRGNALRPLSFVVGGAGAASLLASVGFALYAKNLDQQAMSGHCDESGCDTKGLELNASARRAGDTATVLAVSGGVLVAGGVTLWFLSRERPSDPSQGSYLRLGTAFSARGTFATFDGGF